MGTPEQNCCAAKSDINQAAHGTDFQFTTTAPSVPVCPNTCVWSELAVILY